MSNELTAAEEDAITLTIDTEEPTLNVAPLLREVSRIVAAREAAARREALLEAAEESEMRINLANRVTFLEAKVARVEVLLAEMDNEVDDYSASDATNPYDKGADDQLTTDRRRLRAALAEPERDEESGR